MGSLHFHFQTIKAPYIPTLSTGIHLLLLPEPDKVTALRNN